jgi:signal transduction histidine kinase
MDDQMDKEVKPKILIIEDENDVRESYVDMLAFLGHEVTTAENGKDGLEKIFRENYDIVLTDLNMPVMDGLEALRRIKKKNSDIEVIVITGFATIENAIGAMKQGAFDYITKPVSLEHVRIVLNKCIQQINARKENVKLKNINTELTQLNELKNKFITITNHELRTPLAVLKGYLDLMEMELEGKTNEDLDEYMSIISNTTNEMIDMIESMHDLSHVDKLISDQNKTILDINEIAEKVYKETKVLFDKRAIKYTLCTEKKAQKILADAYLMKKAIRELVQNALKFTDSGGQVSLSIKNIHVNKQVYIIVEDEGIGIPAEKLQLIFEPFYEVQDVMHHFTSRTDFMGGGIGVGLSLVQGIIASSDGEIAIESTPNNGSTFTIILPLAEVEERVVEMA